jgi:hypothetical protein
MTNLLEAPRKIARMAMVELENSLPIGRLVYRDYAREFGPGETGDVVSIRRPVQFEAVEGPSAPDQAIIDGNVSLTINRNPVVKYPITMKELALNDAALADRFARPAARAIANKIEEAIAALYWKVPHWVGTPGQLLRVRGDVGRAVARLIENGMPENEAINAVMTVADHENLSNDISRLPGTNAISTEALRRGVRGEIAGADLYRSNVIARHLRGVWSTAGTIEVDGANQFVTYNTVRNLYQQTLNLKGGLNNVTAWARRGDVFEIEGVFAVNPVTKQVYPHRRQFTVLADANTDGTGDAALTISPPIITSGPYQTVSAAPADSADIFVIGAAGTYNQNMTFHRNAFALAMIPLAQPIGSSFSAVESYKGFSMRVTADFDIDNGKSSIRFESLFGVECINPELAVRMSGTSA